MSDTTAAAPAPVEAAPAPSALAPAPVDASTDAAITPPVAPQPLPGAEAPKPADAPPAEKPAEKVEPKKDEAKKPVIELAGPLGEKFKAFAKEHGIDEGKQSDLASFYIAAQAEAEKAQAAEWQKVDAGFRDALRSDPVIGGQNYDAAIATARKGVEWAGGVELARLFDSTGLGNHPALVKAFHKLGKSLSEDSVSGTSSQDNASSEQSAEAHLALLYPSMFPKH